MKVPIIGIFMYLPTLPLEVGDRDIFLVIYFFAKNTYKTR